MAFQEEPALEPDQSSRISGLNYICDFIAAADAEALIKTIDKYNWSTELKRRVQHYGFRYDYRARRVEAVDRLGPLPGWLQKLAETLLEQKIFKVPPDQVIINEYLPGQGIAPHIDCIPCFGEIVASLSLGSTCEMVLSAPDGQKYEQVLTPNSLLCLTGPARFQYEHGIPARKTDLINGARLPRKRRLSLTFRTVNLG